MEWGVAGLSDGPNLAEETPIRSDRPATAPHFPEELSAPMADERDVERGVQSRKSAAMIAPITTIAATG
jgi:hypothetical protein